MPAPSSAEAGAPKPRRVDLAAGFAGRALTLTGLERCYSCSFADLRRVDPFVALREAEAGLLDHQCIAGFLAYEAAMAVEASLDLPQPPIDLPAVWFGVFDGALALSIEDADSPIALHADEGLGREAYAANAENIRQRIAAGDVFQVNISHRQTATFGGGRTLFERLPAQQALKARYGARFDFGRQGLISASPELFLSLEGGTLASEPIKGTRPRAEDKATDQLLLRELLTDPKDRAENIMIADLMRNDLAKVCADGSIREPVICGARSLSAVHHLYSRIEGRLRDGLLFADALRAAFPCGSVTGAPKLAAMNAIAEIEGEGRGPYCGSIFLIEKRRAVASVAIRTAVVDDVSGRVDVRSGGGVTMLSDPYAEYQEALDKGYLFRLLTGQP